MSVKTLYRIAAFEIRPLSYVNQLYYEMILPTNESTTRQKVVKKTQKFIGLSLLGLPALLGGFFSCSTRFLATRLNPQPFMFMNTSLLETEPKKFPQQSSALEGQRVVLKVFSWNVCAMSGGFPYATGGVRPWRQRLTDIALEIKKRDADVVCLQEMHDNDASWRLIDELKSVYFYFYYNIGSPYFGANSGLFVASKYEIKNPQFSTFQSKIRLIDSCFTGKGYFSFELALQNHKIVRLFNTHFQHSQDDLTPLQTEKQVREEQMSQIVSTIQGQEKTSSAETLFLIVGDFNTTPDEYNSSTYQNLFVNLLLSSTSSTMVEERLRGAGVNQEDGNGEEIGKAKETRFLQASCFYQELMYKLWENRTVKDENSTIDYALVYKNEAVERDGFSARTEIVDAEEVLAIDWGKEGEPEGVLDPQRALSDHLPLMTTLMV